MPALTKTDMFELVTRFNDEFQPCLEKTEYGTCKTPGPCVATPRRMKVVLDELQAYTDEVQSARNQHKALGIASIALGPAGIPITDLLGGGEVNVPQWRRDMANWQFRLAQYQLALAQYTAAHPTELDTSAGCEAIYRKITAPLLDGVFYEIMPGIIYSQDEKEAIARGEGAERTVNDVITPFTLGNQIIVYQDFQKENAERFFQELIDNTKKVLDEITTPGGWPWWLKAALVAGAGLAVGLTGLYVYQFLPKPPKSNPRRKLKAKQKASPTSEEDIKYETEHYFVLDVGPRGYEVYRVGATHGTRVASIGHGPGPRLGLERAVAEADRRERESNPKGRRKPKQLADPRKLYSDSDIMEFYAMEEGWRRGSLEAGTAEIKKIGEGGKPRWKELPKKSSNPRSRSGPPRVLKTVESHELEPGMRVITPLRYRDEDGKMRPLGRIWPNAPDELVVEVWDWEDGESKLTDPSGEQYLDLNVLDYPKTWQVTAVQGGWRV